MKTTSTLKENPMLGWIEAWKERTRGDRLTVWGVPTESLPPGHNLPLKLCTTLLVLKKNLNISGMIDNANCQCGEQQTSSRLYLIAH